MGKPTGFLDYERVDSEAVKPKNRIMSFTLRSPLRSRGSRRHGAWIAGFRSASRVSC